MLITLAGFSILFLSAFTLSAMSHFRRRQPLHARAQAFAEAMRWLTAIGDIDFH
jgi:hypothetical protein